MTPKQRQRLARILRRTAADVEAESPINLGDEGAVAAAINIVDTAELLDLIAKWGWIVDSPMVAHAPPAMPEPEPPPVTQPPSTTLPEVPPMVDLAAMVVIGKAIHSIGNCITRNNGGLCTITVDQSVLQSQSGYGIYADTSTFTKVNASHIESVNYYCLRGHHIRLESTGSMWISPNHSFRIYGWRQGYSQRDTFNVEYLRLGGGGSDEWTNEIDTGGTPAAPIVFSDGRILATKQVTIYDATHDITFRNMDFAGTGKIFIDLGATNIRFENCRNMPTVDVKGQSSAQLAARGIVIIAGTTVTIT